MFQLAKTITAEQVQRLRNDNKRLIGLTERLNNQRSTMEERFKEKKSEVVELEKQVAQRNVGHKLHICKFGTLPVF